jgi:hypothetical protein
MTSNQNGPKGLPYAQLSELEEILRGCERALHILRNPSFQSNRKIIGLQTVFDVAQSVVRHLLINGVRDDPAPVARSAGVGGEKGGRSDGDFSILPLDAIEVCVHYNCCGACEECDRLAQEVDESAHELSLVDDQLSVLAGDPSRFAHFQAIALQGIRVRAEDSFDKARVQLVGHQKSHALQ